MNADQEPPTFDPVTWRPPGHPEDKPWPPVLREYPPDHPARRNEPSTEAFNWDWAVEDFGTDFCTRIREMSGGFRGDWWLLASLHRFLELANNWDPDGTRSDRCWHWHDFINRQHARGGLMHLEGASFRNLDMRCVFLASAYLNMAEFWDTDASGAELHSAELQDARFHGCKADRTVFSHARMNRASLNGSFVRASFDSTKLENGSISGDFSRTVFNRAYMRGFQVEACVEGASFEGVDLEEARLSTLCKGAALFVGANLQRALVQHADLSGSRLDGASLSHAAVEKTLLDRCDLRGANLTQTRITESSLRGADLRGVLGLHFDANRIRDIHIEGNAPDPWSILRRKYTGPMFFVHSSLLVAFILAQAAKVVALSAADHASQMLAGLQNQFSGNIPMHIERIPAIYVLIGLDRAWWVPVLLGVLVLYNAIRAVLTLEIGQLRDAEERSGVSPKIDEYMGTQGLSHESPLGCLKEFGFESLCWLSNKMDHWLEPSECRQAPNPLQWVAQVGFWRLHRLQKFLLVIAALSFVLNLSHWVFTATVPDVRWAWPADGPPVP